MVIADYVFGRWASVGGGGSLGCSLSLLGVLLCFASGCGELSISVLSRPSAMMFLIGNNEP